MNKRELEKKTEAVVAESRAALQAVYDALNQGQKNQLAKREEIKALFYRYGVTY